MLSFTKELSPINLIDLYKNEKCRPTHPHPPTMTVGNSLRFLRRFVTCPVVVG